MRAMTDSSMRQARRLRRFQLALVLVFAGASSALALARPHRGPQPARRPNILLAIADDWSFPHAGAYGDTTVRTPTVDRLAREGVRFTHAFVAAPSCTPSRAALLTGQAIHRLEEGGARSRHPASADGGLLVGGHLPVGLEATEVVNADDVH